MDEFLLFSLGTGAAMMLVLNAITEIDSWRKRRHMKRVQRVKRELAETQRNLEALALQHQAWLNAQAHEARKALIVESFIASRDPQDTAVSRGRTR
ncbi:MAG: hypothetical protein LLG45_09005 [Actinomycetia bacterium]|nr:hypothetical protein [Actinomycetes bacterium]